MPVKYFSRLLWVVATAFLSAVLLPAQSIVEGTRVDLTEDLQLDKARGQFARLFIPDYHTTSSDGGIVLVLHLHGASWATENQVYKSSYDAVLLSLHLAGLSSFYQNYFADKTRLHQILDRVLVELETLGIADNPRVTQLIVTSFSVGYAGVREILKERSYYRRISALVLADGLHSDSDPVTMSVQMADFLRFAQDAREGTKVLIITHSSIPTPGYASTTQTADYLLNGMALRREAANRTDAIGTQASVVDTGQFHVRGYLGQTGADHLKHLHAMHLMLRQVMGILAAQ